jgi:hypothetical protein
MLVKVVTKSTIKLFLFFRFFVFSFFRFFVFSFFYLGILEFSNLISVLFLFLEEYRTEQISEKADSLTPEDLFGKLFRKSKSCATIHRGLRDTELSTDRSSVTYMPTTTIIAVKATMYAVFFVAVAALSCVEGFSALGASRITATKVQKNRKFHLLKRVIS